MIQWRNRLGSFFTNNQRNIDNFRYANNVKIDHEISAIEGTQVNLGSFGSLKDQLKIIFIRQKR